MFVIDSHLDPIGDQNDIQYLLIFLNIFCILLSVPAEVKQFPGHTGFDGSDSDWAAEYQMLCSSYNGVQSAISLSLFEKLVDDETDDGCYCTDEEHSTVKSRPSDRQQGIGDSQERI